MSIPFHGRISPSGGLSRAIAIALKNVTLKPVKKVAVKFDPFHVKVKHTREFLFNINTAHVLKTNLNCVLRTEVVCDRSDPTITFTLVNGDVVHLKAANLTTLEMFQLYNKHISCLVPADVVTPAIQSQLRQKKKRN